jgi:hypothetical protein
VNQTCFIQPFSSLFSLQQLRGLRKIHNWGRQYAEGASSHSWNRQPGCEAAKHRGLGAYRGGSLSVCALDVGALDFLLNDYGRAQKRLTPSFFLNKLADYSGRIEGRQV